MEYDAFISHASEDKNGFVRDLANALQREGAKVWYDEFSLTIGDSLREKIDEGLALSKFGIVVLSKNFFGKHWPTRELNGLATKEARGGKVILPVWLDVSKEEVEGFSLPLADKLAARSEQGLTEVVRLLLQVIRPPKGSDVAPPQAPEQRSQKTTVLTMTALAKFAEAKDSTVEWPRHLPSIYDALLSLKFSLVEQVEESIDDPKSRGILDTLYARLLSRKSDIVGQFAFLPWIFLKGEVGIRVVESAIMNSPEYQNRLINRKLGMLTPVGSRIVKFRVDKDRPDGIERRVIVRDGKVVRTEVSAENALNGYVHRRDLESIAKDMREHFQIEEYTKATERLHGYTVEMVNSGAPSAQADEGYYRHLKKLAVLQAADRIEGGDGQVIVNAYDPNGLAVVKSFDAKGQYYSAESVGDKIVAKYDLHEAIEFGILHNREIRAPFTVDEFLDDYVNSDGAKKLGVVDWEKRSKDFTFEALIVEFKKGQDVEFDFTDLREFSKKWKSTKKKVQD